jgi:sugar/nucleoside kinase (ribokinase family)
MDVGRTHSKGHLPKGLFVGLATVDLAYTVDKIPSTNTKISVPDQQISAGGPATNAAVTFAFLGGQSTLVTAVGKHPLGAVIRQDLDRFSVVLHDVAMQRKEAPAVSSILTVRGSGERTVVSANAAAFGSINAKLNPAWLTGMSIVQVDGHHMALCIAGARFARARDIPVVLDSGSWKEGMTRLLPWIDIAICSDDFRPPGCRDEADTLEFLLGQGIRQLAITRGAAPVIYLDNGKAGKIPVKQLRPTDTLGAGDVFHGAFCYCACQTGRSFRNCLTFAARVATGSCLHRGTRSWMQAFPCRQVLPTRA